MQKEFVALKDKLEECVKALGVYSKYSSDLLLEAEKLEKEKLGFVEEKPDQKTLQAEKKIAFRLDRDEDAYEVRKGYKYFIVKKDGPSFISKTDLTISLNQADTMAAMIETLLGDGEIKKDVEKKIKALLFIVNFTNETPNLRNSKHLINLVFTDEFKKEIRPEIIDIYKNLTGRELSADLKLRNTEIARHGGIIYGRF